MKYVMLIFSYDLVIKCQRYSDLILIRHTQPCHNIIIYMQNIKAFDIKTKHVLLLTRLCLQTDDILKPV